MKRLTFTAIGLAITTIVFSQGLKPVAHKITERRLQTEFTSESIFELSNSATERSVQLTNTVSRSTVMDVKQSALQSLLTSKPENLQLSIPVTGNTNLVLELVRAYIFTPDFTVVTSASNGLPVQYQPGLHYQGIIKGDNASLAAISIFDNEVMGMISSPADGNVVLGKIENDPSGRHILYNTEDMTAPQPLVCSTPDDGGTYSNKDLKDPGTESVNCIRLYWEVNYDIHQGKGGVTNATNYVTGVFNQSAIIYTNDGIPVSLSQVFVWSTTSPYTSTSTSGLLSQFQSYRNSFNGDLGHLIGYAGSGGIAAGFSGLCNSNMDSRQCYSGISSSYNNVPTYSWTVMVVTHEQGHLMGSRHTHACVWNGNNTAIDNCGPTAGYGYEGSCSGAPTPTNGGTIMSYCHAVSGVGINFSNGFGSQPKTTILNKYNAASCLTACTGGTCNAPTGMSTTGITTSSATFNWTAASGATSYNVQYRVVGTSTWTAGTTASTSFTATGLAAATGHEWQVRTVCSSGTSAYTASTNFTTASATCGTPSGLSSSGISGSGATVSWGAVSGATSYTLGYKLTSASTWTTITGVTGTSRALTGLTSCSSYQFRVQAVCASGSGAYSSTGSFTTTGCTVTYCTSSGTNTSYEYINRIVLGTINNTSGSNSGYGNYTALSTNLAGSTSHTITLYPGFTGSSYREYWKVYIDYNKNGVFTDGGENVVTTNSTTSVSASFTVPSTALNGATRMRVQMRYNSYATSSCGSFTYGEVEDYTVNITGNAQLTNGLVSQVSTDQALSVYPNPANDKVAVEFNSVANGTGRITVYSLLGEAVMKQDLIVIEGLNNNTIQIGNLGSGVYILDAEINGTVSRQRFIVSE